MMKNENSKKRYRVEARIDKNNYFMVDCDETDLEYHKAICKYDVSKSGGECYYREFPLTKNKKIYYAKDNPNLTSDELKMIIRKLENRLND